MHVLVAPDSFKGSVSAQRAGEIIKKVVIQEIPNVTVDVVPMSDGGEGTLDVLLHSSNGEKINISVKDAKGVYTETVYGVLSDKETVVIEVALIAGFTSIQEHQRNPLELNTYGIGECIIHALDSGYRKFIFCLGGSATNDGGIGMLQALGVKFKTKDGDSIEPNPSQMSLIDKVDYSYIDQRLADSVLSIASDVTNPLYGNNGATHVFGPQKGVLQDDLNVLDNTLKNYSKNIESSLNKKYNHIPGSGAAGGLGFALLTIGAKIESGAELIANKLGIKEILKVSDLVITGEGKTDTQTLQGKLPFVIAKMAKEYQVPSILLSGSIEGEFEPFYDVFDSFHSIANGPISLEESIKNTETLIFNSMKNIIRLLKISI